MSGVDLAARFYGSTCRLVHRYRVLAKKMRHPYCLLCDHRENRVDAASLAYDLAVAEASLARVRASVAYA